MGIVRLTDDERAALLLRFPLWRHEPSRDAIVRDFRFGDFARAFGFMTAVAIVAERQDHHPEWSNVYNRVTVLLTTHDAGGLSQRDAALAEVIDDIAVRFA